MSNKKMHKKPTLTVLVQTMQGEIAQQYRDLCNVVKNDLRRVNVLSVELTLGQYNMLVKMSGEEIESLVSAQRKIAGLGFVQNTASIVTYSEEVVPDEIGGYKVTHDAKEEVLQYLGSTQQSTVRNVDDLRKILETLLALAIKAVKQGDQITSTEIRFAEQELRRRDAKLKNAARAIAAIVGTCSIIPAIALAFILLTSPKFNLTFQTLFYMIGLSIVGVVSLLMAIDHKQVKAAIKIAIKIAMGRHSSK